MRNRVKKTNRVGRSFHISIRYLEYRTASDLNKFEFRTGRDHNSRLANFETFESSPVTDRQFKDYQGSVDRKDGSVDIREIKKLTMSFACK